MSKAREKKALLIDDLRDALSQSSAGILTDYRGLSTSDMNVLRRKLKSRLVARLVAGTLPRVGCQTLVGWLSPQRRSGGVPRARPRCN